MSAPVKAIDGKIDKKSAIKLINSYAESYKQTEDKIHLLPEVEGTMSLIQIFRNSYQSPVWPRNTGDL